MLIVCPDGALAPGRSFRDANIVDGAGKAVIAQKGEQMGEPRLTRDIIVLRVV